MISEEKGSVIREEERKLFELKYLVTALKKKKKAMPWDKKLDADKLSVL